MLIRTIVTTGSGAKGAKRRQRWGQKHSGTLEESRADKPCCTEHTHAWVEEGKEKSRALEERGGQGRATMATAALVATTALVARPRTFSQLTAVQSRKGSNKDIPSFDCSDPFEFS